MGRISTGIGLVSGINSKDIIDQLMALEARPKATLQRRIDQTNQQKLAYADLVTRLTSLKLSGTTLKKAATFQQATAASGNENVLTATASAGAAKGTYQFQVARLVTSQQSVSAGFATENTRVGAGTLTLELGGGEVFTQTQLSQLNGGNGVRRGSFRVTDGAGRSAVIDISTALNLDDVVRNINTSLDITVSAKVDGDRLVLTDLSGGASPITVTDLGGGNAAADLGIRGSGVGSTLQGTSINSLGRATALSHLNDGRGVRTSTGGADLRITSSSGTTYDIDLDGLTTVGSVLDAINTATAGTVAASVAPGGRSLLLTDTAGGGGAVSVSALNGSKAAADLGIEQAGTGATLTGRTVLASLNTVLLSSLRGGQGLSLGSVSFTNRAGAAKTINFAGAETVTDLLDRINSDPDLHLTARIKDSGNGIELIDNSGGAGNLVIADASSTTAAELGIAGTFALASPSVKGANLQRQWIGENTLLSTYNGGRGVAAGKFRITNSNGQSAEIDLSEISGKTLGEVISRINSATVAEGQPLGVVASINANGDGLLLTDAAGGAAKMKVEELDGTTAADLNIKGTAAATTIDGSFERTISLDANDTLATVLDKINLPGFALSAAIINDGSGATPYRLSLTARNSGSAGRVLFDAGATALQTTNLVEAQDALVFYGGAGATQPLMITSGSNKLDNVIKGVTIDLHAVSASPVALSVTDNVDNVVSELKKFAENFNGLVDRIQDLTKYDTKTNARGLLLGELAPQQIQTELYGIVNAVLSGAGNFKILAEIGLKGTPGAHIEFDEAKFRSAYAADAQSVKSLFTLFQAGSETTPAKRGIGYIMEERITRLIDPAHGILTLENRELEQRTEQFQDRIDQLDKSIEAKRARLERQFANMESVLANLQSQQQALAGFSGVQPLTSAKK